MRSILTKAGRCYLRALAGMRSAPKRGPDGRKADVAWVLAGRLLASTMRRAGLDPLRDVDGILQDAGMPDTYRREVAHTVGHAETSLHAATVVMPGMIDLWDREGAYGI